jgi:hypothetical protein
MNVDALPAVNEIESLCARIPITADIAIANSELADLTLKLRINRHIQEALLGPTGVYSINLTHLPGLQGHHRFSKYTGQHSLLLADKVNESMFIYRLAEIKNTYIAEVMNKVIAYHKDTYGTEFKGRTQIVWSLAGLCDYPLHTDPHTPHRYHIPLQTDPNFNWVFSVDDELCKLHMPADGGIWYLNPVKLIHTVRHTGTVPRIHLLMTTV